MKYSAVKLELNKCLKCEQLDETTYLIFNQSENTYHIINSTAKFILDNCADSSVDNILQMMKKQYIFSDTSEEEIVADIEYILDDFLEKRIIFPEKHFMTDSVRQTIREELCK